MRASLFFCFTLVACGGSVTTVDGDKNTSTLQPTDQHQLCLDTYTYVRNAFSNDDIAKLQCGFGQSTSQDPQTCDSTYEACLASARANTQQIQWPTTPDCTNFETQIAGCNTTVAEYSKCLEQEVDATKVMESTFPYCTMAEREQAAISAATHLSQDCLQLLETCHATFVPGN